MNERAPLGHVLGKRALVYIGILAFAFVLLLVLNANSGNASAAGPTYVYRDISTDTQWTEANSPYIVNASIEILPGKTLTIGPNVTVMVNGGEGITVSGKILAQGTAAKWVDFTTNATSPFGYWNGLYFDSNSSGSILSYVIVQNASIGVNVVNSTVSMSNVELVNNDYAGLNWVVNDGKDLTTTITNVDASGNSSLYTDQGMFFLVDGGNATVSIRNSNAMDDYAAGIAIEATGKVSLTVSDTTVSNSGNTGILAYSTTGDVVANFKNLTVADCGGFGVLVWAPNGKATVMVDPSDLSGTGESGLQVEAMGSTNLTVVDTIFTDCYVGVSVYADTGPATIDLTNVSFKGCANGLVVDVTNGDATINVDKTVMSAPENGGFVNYYPAEISATYDIINPGVNHMSSSDISTGYMYVELPFDFPYAGGSFTDAYMWIYGYIALGNSSSGLYIAPAADNFVAADMNFCGYKVYSDRIVFQWYVYAGWSQSYLRDVFEAVLYENGDIQFNYAAMETVLSGTSNFYGLQGPYYPVILNQITDPNVYNMDHRSVYLRMERFNYGQGIYVEASGNVTAKLTESTVSHFLENGVGLFTANGWISAEVMNSSIEYILSFAMYGSGLIAWTNNGTMTATLQNSTFGYVAVAGSAFLSDPLWGGKNTVTVKDCTFDNIGYGSLLVYVMVDDNDGFNKIVNFESTTTITGNNFKDAAGVTVVTMIASQDSVWNVTMTETMKNNTFIGTPPVTGIVGKPFGPQPSSDGINEGLLTSYSQVVSAVDDNAKVKKTAVITGNSMEAQTLSTGPDAPAQPSMGYGISVEDSAIAVNGAVTQAETVTVTDNILNAAAYSFNTAIFVEMFGNAIDANLTSNLMANVSSNELLSKSFLGDGIDVELRQDLNNGRGNGTLVGDVVVENNVLQNADWAIYVFLEGGDLYNQWGDQTAAVSALVNGNNITSSYGGIEVDVYSYCLFENYFPPYETEVSANLVTTYDVRITKNKVGVSGDGIYLDIESYVSDDYYGVFTHAKLNSSGATDISDNEVAFTTGYGWYGIWTDYYAYAEYGNAMGKFNDKLVVKDNVVTGPDLGIEYGVYVYRDVEAYTYDLRFDDTPTVVETSDIAITGNTISMANAGIEAYPEVYVGYGLSSVTSVMSISIMENKITDVVTSYLGNSTDGWGIYLYPEEDIDNYAYNGYSTNAVADITWSILVSGNVIKWTDENTNAHGIHGMYDVVSSDIENGYLTWNLVTEITSNTLTGTGGDEAIYVGPAPEVYPYLDPTTAGMFDISGNTITGTVDYSIYAEYADVTISRNAISGISDDGMYLYESTGSVSNNTVSGAYNEGIYVDSCWDMMIVGNTLTNNGLTGGESYGLGVEYCTDISVMDNVITGNYYGLYVDVSSHVIVRNNVVDKNLWGGAEFSYSDQLIIEANSFSANGGDGVDMYYIDNVVFGNNTVNQNVERGLSVSNYYGTSLMMYNGVFADNGWYGMYVETGSSVWIVDSASAVRDNPVWFQGDITVVSGGVLTIDTATDFTMAPDNLDGLASIIVKEGGKLVARNSWIWGVGMGGTEVSQGPGSYFEFSVYGTLDMESSTVEGAKELYLGPTSTASVRTSTIMDNYLNGIHVDNCSPTISGTKILSNWMDGIFIEGPKANPKIRDCLIMENTRGVYAYNSILGDVTDNLIVMNDVAGIYADHSNGKIHDNIMLFNKREIWIKDSNVSVQSNQIGYSQLVNVMAKYLPLLSMGSSMPVSIGGFEISPELMTMMMLDHIGIYAENSTVSASNNVYGLLTYAVYVVDSQLNFNDKVLASELTIPYFDSTGKLLNITVPIHVYDGIYASNSSVTVNGGYIQVLDDAIFLEKSTADLRNVGLNATDMDVYLTDGSTSSATNVTFDGGTMAEDTSVLTVNYKLTVIAVDQDGKPVGGVWIVVRDAAGNMTAEGATGDDGMFVTYVVGYVQTSAGKSTAMNPYLLNASFDQGSVLKSVTVNSPTEVTVQVPVKKVKPIDLAPIAAIVLIAIILMVMLLLVIRGRP